MVPAPTQIYTLSLHDALPIYDFPYPEGVRNQASAGAGSRRPRTRGTSTAAAIAPASENAAPIRKARWKRSEEHTSELQSQFHLVCRLLLEKKNTEVGNRSRNG